MLTVKNEKIFEKPVTIPTYKKNFYSISKTTDIISMNNYVMKKLIPVALVTLLTSTFLYGTTPYTITSVTGGPIKDEIGGVLSVAETPTHNKLLFSAEVVKKFRALTNSVWLDESNNPMFPFGSELCVVKYTVTNNSDEDMNIYGMYIKAVFENNHMLAANQLPAEDAEHVKMGYLPYLIDHFGENANEWVLKPGQSVSFAETYYVENPKLNVSFIYPNAAGEKSSEDFKLEC